MFEIQAESVTQSEYLFKTEHHKDKLLIVDKDVKYCRLFIDFFSRYGYEVSVTSDVVEALNMIATTNFDTVIVDVVMPGMNGFQILKKIRSISEVPIVLLTEFQDETDAILGLELGADDFLQKNLSPRELLARLKALNRRTSKHTTSSSQELKIGHLIINLSNRSASDAGRHLRLTTVEFDLLVLLAQNKGCIKTRQQLLSEISDRNYTVTDRSIDVHISSLRRKLKDDPTNPKFIKTIRTIGYMLLNPAD